MLDKIKGGCLLGWYPYGISYCICIHKKVSFHFLVRLGMRGESRKNQSINQSVIRSINNFIQVSELQSVKNHLLQTLSKILKY